MTVTVIRRNDGKYFQGCGYAGPGNPVPYWTDRIWEAQAYRTTEGARKTAQRIGGYIGAADTTDNMPIPDRWLGFLVRSRDGWRTVDADPQDFDPNDYEGNNGPL